MRIISTLIDYEHWHDVHVFSSQDEAFYVGCKIPKHHRHKFSVRPSSDLKGYILIQDEKCRWGNALTSGQVERVLNNQFMLF